MNWDFDNIKKICIVGRAASGKSYLATRLGETLNMPVIYLDMEFWRPNWTHVDEKTLYENVASKMTDKWIVDGNYLSNVPLMELRFLQSDLVIYIDETVDECIERAHNRRNMPRVDFPDFLDEENKDEFEWLIERIKNWETDSAPMFELIDPKKLLVLRGRTGVDTFLSELS